VIRWLAGVFRFGDHAAIWRAALPAPPATGAGWFLGRFLDASSVAVRRWGPRWSANRRLLGREIGTWILVLLWLGAPLGLAIQTAHGFWR